MDFLFWTLRFYIDLIIAFAFKVYFWLIFPWAWLFFFFLHQYMSFPDLLRIYFGALSEVSLSVQFSHSVVPDSLRPCGLQHARLPCPSLTPRACSVSCPPSRWCHPAISSSVVPFSSRLQSCPASGSFPVSCCLNSPLLPPSVGLDSPLLPPIAAQFLTAFFFFFLQHSFFFSLQHSYTILTAWSSFP